MNSVDSVDKLGLVFMCLFILGKIYSYRQFKYYYSILILNKTHYYVVFGERKN